MAFIWSSSDVPKGWWKDSIQFSQCLCKTDVTIQLAKKRRSERLSEGPKSRVKLKSVFSKAVTCGRQNNGLPTMSMGFPCGSAGKESAYNAGDLGSMPGLGRSPGEGKGYPLQYSGLENSMDCIVHGVAKSWTRLDDFHFHNDVHILLSRTCEYVRVRGKGNEGCRWD